MASQDLNVLRFADGTPARVQASGVAIDLVAYLVQPTSYTNDLNAERAWVLSGSALAAAEEGGIWEQVLGVPGVSAVRVLQVANAQRVPILVIDQTNLNAQLARLQTFANVEAFIRALVEAGLVVEVPERNVQIEEWFGTGFTAVDRQTGASGWFIAGVLPFGFPLGGSTAQRVRVTPQIASDESRRTQCLLGVIARIFAFELVGAFGSFHVAVGADVLFGVALTLTPPAAAVIAVGVGLMAVGIGVYFVLISIRETLEEARRLGQC